MRSSVSRPLALFTIHQSGKQYTRVSIREVLIVYIASSTIFCLLSSAHGEFPVMENVRKKGELTACVIGHSWVRRLGVKVCGRSRNEARAARNAARSMRLDATYSQIHVMGKAGYLVTEIRKDIFKAGQMSPDVVVINCGSNDLCDYRCDPSKVANALVSYAKLLRLSYHVRYVVLLSIVRRKRCRRATQDQFWDRAYEVNKLLGSMTQNTAGIDFVVLKGFSKCPDGKTVLPVDDWSGDGIHPDDDEGGKKYLRNIRGCLLTGAAKCLGR